MAASSCPTAPAAPIAALLDLIDAACDGAAVDDALLVRVVGRGEPLELGLRPLEGEHPVDALLGCRAEPDWSAVGIVAPGHARSLDAGPTAAPTRVRVLHVVDRSGGCASLIHELDAGRTIRPPEPPSGRLVDCCLRVLGLPTPPPPAGITTWWSVRWLDAVLAMAVRETQRSFGWLDVARLHPLALSADRLGEPHKLTRLIRTAAAASSWDTLRRNVMAGTCRGLVTSDVAGWMDDGMFARWLLEPYPELDDLLGDLGAVLDDEGVVASIEAVVAASVGS